MVINRTKRTRLNKAEDLKYRVILESSVIRVQAIELGA